MQKKISRRQFLSRSAAIGGGVAFPYFIPSGVLAAPGKLGTNDRISVGHIGVGGRGTSLLRDTLKHSECVVTAVCDVDKGKLDAAARVAGEKAQTYTDYRRVLEDKSIDAVVIGAPDHWHALMTVHACQTGKDVYCEKPACNTIAEGQAMIKAVKEYKRVVQIGSQGRSQKDSIAACEYIRNGQLGKVTRVTCWHPLNREGGFEPNSDPPPGLDWDKWLGPAAWRPFNRAYHPAGFRWFLDLGGGNIRDRGAHIFSLALWFMNADEQAPVSVETFGAPPRRGICDCPTLMQATYAFKNPDWTLVWEQPGAIPEGRKQIYGSRYWGDKDSLWLEGGDGGCKTEQKALDFKVPADGQTVYHSPGHFADFIKCIKTREKPIMHIEAGVKVANLCILGNLSYLLKRKLQWDAAAAGFVADEEANKLLSRPGRGEWHL